MPQICTICQRPDRLQIDQEIQAKLSSHEIARRHPGITHDSVDRHRARHVAAPQVPYERLKPRVKPEPERPRKRPERMRPLDQLALIGSNLWDQLDRALMANSTMTALNISRELRALVMDRARLSGELAMVDNRALTGGRQPLSITLDFGARLEDGYGPTAGIARPAVPPPVASQVPAVAAEVLEATPPTLEPAARHVEAPAASGEADGGVLPAAASAEVVEPPNNPFEVAMRRDMEQAERNRVHWAAQMPNVVNADVLDAPVRRILPNQAVQGFVPSLEVTNETG